MKLYQIQESKALPDLPHGWVWNKGGSIDVLCDVESDDDEINVKNYMQKYGFYSATGTFDISGYDLHTLKGGPVYVDRDFYCYHNDLTTLEHGPKAVNGLYDASDNPLTNITGIGTCASLMINVKHFTWMGYQQLLIASKKIRTIHCNDVTEVNELIDKYRDAQDMLGFQGDLLDAGLI